MLPMGYVDARATKFFFHEFFLAAPIFTSRETFEKLLTEQMFLCKMVILQETYLVSGCWLVCCFCIVSASYLPLSSWCGRSQQPDWACFWLIANAGVPGNCSWSLQHRSTNSTTSHALGSLRAISRRQWLACVDDANLALLVPGRLARGRL